MKTELLALATQSIAVRRAGTRGPFIVLVHGNSCSSRCYERQLESELAQRFQLVALDLPGHGDSPPAPVKSAYSLPFYASVVVEAAEALGASRGVFVGWSMGGYTLVEASPQLTEAAGVLLFGAPPIASPADLPRALSADPRVGAGFRAENTDDDVRAIVSMFVKPGREVDPRFAEDFKRTRGEARASLAASVAANKLRDGIAALGAFKRPVAVVHGYHDALAHLDYLVEVPIPTLWRGAVQLIPDAGHAPQWESSPDFNRILGDFAADCSGPP